MNRFVSAAAEIVKKVVRRTRLYDGILFIRQRKAFREWGNRGRVPASPHLLKQSTVKEYGRRFSIDTLVETGTYLGEMLYATRGTFRKIVSVELDRVLYERAKKKFARYSHISIINGDSGELLSEILADIERPCLFWLDAHYSRGITGKGGVETPILQELHHILNHPVEDHVILIDDARLFVGRNDYPTLEQLENLIHDAHRDWAFEVEDDIIRIHKTHKR